MTGVQTCALPISKASDITVLCLPDAAAKELVAAMGDSDTVVIDASTAHRVADGWTYGFPELAKDDPSLVKEVIADREETIKQLESYIHQ